MPYAFALLDHSVNDCCPERRVHMARVSGCERGDGVKSKRHSSSRELQRVRATVLGRFYGSHRTKGVEVGVELQGGVASSVGSAILPTMAGHFAQILLLRGVPQRFHLEVNQWANALPRGSLRVRFVEGDVEASVPTVQYVL